LSLVQAYTKLRSLKLSCIKPISTNKKIGKESHLYKEDVDFHANNTNVHTVARRLESNFMLGSVNDKVYQIRKVSFLRDIILKNKKESA
jgi:hypothetical protein